MIDMNSEITAIILAGGLGRRMSYKNKGLAHYRGVPLIEHVIARVQPQVQTLLISCNDDIDRYRALGFTAFKDQLDDFQGPLAGVSAGLPYVNTPLVLICPCDTPQLPIELVNQLHTVLVDHAADIAYPLTGERKHFLPALINASLATSLSDYLSTGERSVKGWFAQHTCVEVPFDKGDKAFLNINSPE